MFAHWFRTRNRCIRRIPPPPLHLGAITEAAPVLPLPSPPLSAAQLSKEEEEKTKISRERKSKRRGACVRNRENRCNVTVLAMCNSVTFRMIFLVQSYCHQQRVEIVPLFQSLNKPSAAPKSRILPFPSPRSPPWHPTFLLLRRRNGQKQAEGPQVVVGRAAAKEEAAASNLHTWPRRRRRRPSWPSQLWRRPPWTRQEMVRTCECWLPAA